MSGCWLWIGPRNNNALTVGAPFVGLEICHRCDVPACVNPAHLYEGARRENMQDAAKKLRIRNQFGAMVGAR